MNEPMRVLVYRGVIVKLTVLEVPEADAIAQANGFMYAERFIAEHNGRVLRIDKDLKATPDVGMVG